MTNRFLMMFSRGPLPALLKLASIQRSIQNSTSEINQDHHLSRRVMAEPRRSGSGCFAWTACKNPLPYGRGSVQAQTLPVPAGGAVGLQPHQAAMPKAAAAMPKRTIGGGTAYIALTAVRPNIPSV